MMRALMQKVLYRYLMATGSGAVLYRLIGRPDHAEYAAYLRKWMGVEIGEGTTIHPQARFMDKWMVSIGKQCSISDASFVTHTGHDRIIGETTGVSVESRQPIFVGDRVAIGEGAKIQYGVTIGSDCIIGMGAVVRHSIPAGSIVIGNPAQIVGRTEDYIKRRINKPASSPARVYGGREHEMCRESR